MKAHQCVLLVISFINILNTISTTATREFRIDYENDQFLLDGAPFRYVSGSLHYFRVPAIYWRDRLRKIRSAGLNAVSTYVEWRSHEKIPGTFDFSGELNLIQFIQTAAEEGLLVLLRPGPYICAEREMGGLPYWLLRENPRMKLRTNDPTYMAFVQRWLTVLMTRITPLLYGNGGPIIMVQVENEYGSYFTCDRVYLHTLRDILASHVGNAALLYTTDGNSEGYLKCGKIDGVYATVDFGASENVTASFAAMRQYEPHGPLVNSEFYPGWLDHWGEPHNTVATARVVRTLKQMLAINASVNIYMFIGGTNFGFTAGANLALNPGFAPQPTSYDYDAPLSEAGDPTEKYFAIRDTVLQFMPTPPGNLPQPAPKGDYGTVVMKCLGSLFDFIPRQDPVKSLYPLTFENLGQWSGFVMYKTIISKCFPDPAILTAPNVHDQAQVFVNKELVGTLSRMQNIYKMPIQAVPGDEIILLVENQGRVNYGSGLNDFKGLLENVTVDGVVLKYWSMYKIPLEDHGAEVQKMIAQSKLEDEVRKKSRAPALYSGEFVLPSNLTVFPPPDTFLDLAGWFKGIAIINGVNLGRYWSVAGPQRTLYLPGSLLKLAPDTNQLVILELERAPEACSLAGEEEGCTVHMRVDPILDTRGCAIKP